MNTELIVVKGKVIEQAKHFTAEIGEDIGYEAGAKMIKRYFDENNDDVLAFFMGRNMIESILAQPGVVGIRMFNGINDMGIKQIVLVGVDSKGNNILHYTTVNPAGQLVKNKGIVADRAKMCPPYCGDSDTPSDDPSWY
ncbi:hypothetical protein EXU57_23815 [Segetibacter sp. 3557_3]|uniref:hypothetical protein n=1 Tax=Segetibacter sp. 3557_3 TaxID=2547429 RepID=UPI0010583F80|nr:hypothetical protein [Segetibacter sp. 3557_3]TDH18284.1 hypothetical protein EXU57_23815 [Segetibacter sp. 3557_3]